MISHSQRCRDRRIQAIILHKRNVVRRVIVQGEDDEIEGIALNQLINERNKSLGIVSRRRVFQCKRPGNEILLEINVDETALGHDENVSKEFALMLVFQHT